LICRSIILFLINFIFLFISKYFFEYEDYLNAYIHVNRKYGEVIYSIMHENDLIMINDTHLILIPNSLLTKNYNARVGIYIHMAFPSSDVIKTFPYHQELLKSILLCDVIGFHVFQFSRNFLTACKRNFGIFYEIKFRGFITLNYLGRYIIIRVMHAGVDLDYIKSISKTKEFTTHYEYFKQIIKNKFSLVSIDNPSQASGLLLKMEAYKRFLDKFPGARNDIILLQVIKMDENDTKDGLFYKQFEEITNSIIKEYSEDVLKLVFVNKFSVKERFALFSLGSSLYYLQLREGNCMVKLISINYYIVCKRIYNS
jgi:trehalose 6-phosphate synthase/phosphatase